MAWIESHQELGEHPKLFHLAALSGLSTDACIGRLHRLWWWCLKFAEDGDLSRYQSVQIPPIETDEFREHLRTSNWLDGDLIHDWIDYAGLFLTKKYNTGNVPRLKQIWAKHGYKYGKGKGKFTKKEVSKQRVERELKVNIPNLTQPNLTQPNLQDVLVRFDEFWRIYPARDGKKLDKAETLNRFKSLSMEDQILAVQAARNYVDSLERTGIGPKDPKRFLRDGKGHEPWRDWVTPAQPDPPKTAPAVPKAYQPAPKIDESNVVECPPEVAEKLGKLVGTMRVMA